MFKKFLKIRAKIVSLFLAATLALAPTAYALELEISGNGSDSTSEIAAQVETTTTVVQTNEADVANKVETEANTGENQASGNTGGETQISTGDVQEEVVVETAVNSSVAEVGCCPADGEVKISGNGADSENLVALKQTNQTNVIVDQTAKVSNKVSGSANTGGNVANDNNGSVTIKTGDISVSGGVVNGPINTSSVSAGSGGGGFSAKISDNGAGSKNQIKAEFENQTNVFTKYEAYLDNVVYWDLNTGGNEASGNNGDVLIVTGDIDFDFLIKNGPINVGGVIVDCCPFDPGRPGEPGELPADEEFPPEVPHPQPHLNGQQPGPAGPPVGGPAAAIEGILGLADTGGLTDISLFIGWVLMAVGLTLIKPSGRRR